MSSDAARVAELHMEGSLNCSQAAQAETLKEKARPYFGRAFAVPGRLAFVLPGGDAKLLFEGLLEMALVAKTGLKGHLDQRAAGRQQIGSLSQTACNW